MVSHYKTVLGLLTAAAATAVRAQGGVNPNAEGACSPPRGGADACGPNGSEAWLNSGLTEDGGWNPPFLDINSLAHVSLDDYYAGAGGPCRQYDAAFRASGDRYGVDPAILAFIAMQESSCNADEGGPTPGLVSSSYSFSLSISCSHLYIRVRREINLMLTRFHDRCNATPTTARTGNRRASTR